MRYIPKVADWEPQTEILNFTTKLLVNVDTSVETNSVDLLFREFKKILGWQNCVLIAQSSEKHVQLSSKNHLCYMLHKLMVSGYLVAWKFDNVVDSVKTRHRGFAHEMRYVSQYFGVKMSELCKLGELEPELQ
jgi:hypothetical protein